MTTRSYSSIPPQCTLEALATLIEQYYTGLADHFPGLTVSRMLEIQNFIRKGEYTLSPFQLVLNKKRYPKIGFGYIMHIKIDSSNLYGWLTPTLEDRLVLDALGVMLNTRIINLNLLNSSSFGFRVRPADYYAHILSTDGAPISKVYRFDMTTSLRIIKKDLLFRKLVPIVSNSEIISLLKSFLYMKILHEGMDYTRSLGDTVPTIGFLTHVLLNFSLIELDSRFPEVFKSYSYTRYAQEVIVTTTLEDSFFESKLKSFFSSLNLDGKIFSIRPGDKPIPCQHGCHIHLTDEGRLQVFKSDGFSYG